MKEFNSIFCTASPSELLASCSKAYERFETYKDSGFIVDSDRKGANKIRIFKTFFKSPNLFRFDFGPPVGENYTGSFDLNIRIGFDGERLYWIEQPQGGKVQTRSYEKFSRMIAGATGISMGAAHTIASLLIPEMDGFRLTDLNSSKLDGEEVVDGSHCYVLSGSYPGTLGIKLAIDKSSHILRRFESRGVATGGSIIEHRRSIEIDNDLPLSCFQLDNSGSWYMFEEVG